MPGTVYLVGAGPGDPELLTVRGERLLAAADAVLHDELVSPELLLLAKPGALVEYVGKRGDRQGEKELRQGQINERLIELARGGATVVRLKGGDPFLFGRGSEEAEALASAGVPFEIVPGVTSPIAAAAYAGISLTHRDLASSVVFSSGTTKKGEAFDFRELAGHHGTVCILMGLKRIAELTSALVRDAGRAPATPAAVIQAGTRPDQKVVTGTLETIADLARDAALKSPALIVVGEVVALRDRLRWFDARPLFGKRVLCARTADQAGSTAALIRRRGGVPVQVPLIEIVDPPEPSRVVDAARAASGYDVVAFTSENAVRRFMGVAHSIGLDARLFGRASLACVGTGTETALRAFGLSCDFVPSTFRGEALAEAILGHLRARRIDFGASRVLLPRALVAREVLPERLRAEGVTVDVVPVYKTVPADAASASEQIAGCDVVLLTSSSTADALADLLGDRAPDALLGKLVASIGDVTTARAIERGLRVDVTARESTLEALVAAIEAALTTTAES